MPETDPEALGTGVGPLLADYLPFMPSGARRAGAARMMAARIGVKPSVLVTHPILTQLAATAAGGIGYASTEKPLARLLATTLPLVAVQALRRHELHSIQDQYDTDKRLRLREVPELDKLLNETGGSSRLGIVGAYKAMKDRKYQDIGHLAEASDVAPIAMTSTLGIPGLLGSIPITDALDDSAAESIMKKAEFSDQKNTPAIPMYLLAALTAAGMQQAAVHDAIGRMKSGDIVPRDQWEAITSKASGGNPLTVEMGGINNAYYTRPRSNAAAHYMAQEALQDPHVRKAIPTDILRKHLEKQHLAGRLLREGVIFADPRIANAALLAHEGGHGYVDRDKGLTNFLQDKVYPFKNLIAPVSSVGSLAAGLASGSTLKGLLYGTGIGALGSLGVMLPEAAASHRGLTALHGSALGNAKDFKQQLSALGTYFGGYMLPSMLAGAAGGWISGHRQKTEPEEQE